MDFRRRLRSCCVLHKKRLQGFIFKAHAFEELVLIIGVCGIRG